MYIQVAASYTAVHEETTALPKFNVDHETGNLIPLDTVPTLADMLQISPEPSPDGKFLLVGNQDSNEVRTFRVDLDTGRLQPTGAKVDIPRPV